MEQRQQQQSDDASGDTACQFFCGTPVQNERMSVFPFFGFLSVAVTVTLFLGLRNPTRDYRTRDLAVFTTNRLHPDLILLLRRVY